jgi:hypothetical protein
MGVVVGAVGVSADRTRNLLLKLPTVIGSVGGFMSLSGRCIELSMELEGELQVFVVHHFDGDRDW